MTPEERVKAQFEQHDKQYLKPYMTVEQIKRILQIMEDRIKDPTLQERAAMEELRHALLSGVI